MSGLTGSTVTDASGAYTGTEAVDWSGTVTPVLAGYTFAPLSRTYSHIAADQTAQDYTATLLTYTISGTVTLDSSPLAGVVMAGLPGSPVTNAAGTYAAMVNYGSSFTVTPTLEGYTFTPASRTYTSVTADHLADDDTATAVLVPTITVTSPNGGESWARGTAHAVTWTQTGLTGTVTVDLYKGGVYQKTLGTVAATAETFSWVIASNETAGTDYRMLVWQGSISDQSDADFAVVRKPKVDFNNDGQEDILWRYYGTGGYQGLNVAWLMNQTVMPLMLPQGVGATAAAGTVSGPVTPAPQERGAIRTAGFKTLLEGTDRPALTAKQVMTDPMEASRNLGRPTDLRGMLTRKDAAAGTTISAAAGIAALQVNTEVVFSQIPDTAWEVAGTGDFNNDGHTDILWRYYGTGPYQGLNDIWFMNGTQFLGESVFGQIPDTNWRIGGTGDFNNDGHTDILWRYHGTGDYQGLNVLWYMNGTTFVGETVFSQITDTAWQIAGTGDFNNDGHTDILWRYYGTGGYQGLNDVWFLNGTTFLGESVFSQIMDTAWQIAGTGDFNNDGHTDILWRYYGTGGYQGLNDIWYMNGTTFVSEDVFGVIPDTNWRIVNR